MQNLEQIRARNALECAQKEQQIKGKEGGNVIKKIPPLVMNHGLLAAAAYAFDNNGHLAVWNWIARHLADSDIRLLPSDRNDCAKMLDHLTRQEATSEELKLCTTEAMEWLCYARRFIGKDVS